MVNIIVNKEGESYFECLGVTTERIMEIKDAMRQDKTSLNGKIGGFFETIRRHCRTDNEMAALIFLLGEYCNQTADPIIVALSNINLKP